MIVNYFCLTCAMGCKCENITSPSHIRKSLVEIKWLMGVRIRFKMDKINPKPARINILHNYFCILYHLLFIHNVSIMYVTICLIIKMIVDCFCLT